jgi:hypothetical protein
LHSWTLGAGTVAETIAAAGAAGYDAIELNWQNSRLSPGHSLSTMSGNRSIEANWRWL